MKEYRIEAKIRNNLILRKIEDRGFKSVSEFCKKYNFAPGTVGNLINLKEKAISSTLEWRTTVKRMADIFGCDPSDLFTEEQKHMELKSNKRFIEMERKEIEYTMNNPGYILGNMNPEKLALESDTKKIVQEALSILTDKERKVIEMRILEGKTLEETAKNLCLSRERVRQIEAKAFRRFRMFFTSRGLNFKDYLGIK